MMRAVLCVLALGSCIGVQAQVKLKILVRRHHHDHDWSPEMLHFAKQCRKFTREKVRGVIANLVPLLFEPDWQNCETVLEKEGSR